MSALPLLFLTHLLFYQYSLYRKYKILCTLVYLVRLSSIVWKLIEDCPADSFCFLSTAPQVPLFLGSKMNNGRVPAVFLTQFSITSNLRAQFMASLSEFDQDMLELLVQEQLTTGGSRIGRAPNLNRDAPRGHDRLMNDYFVNVPVYGEQHFRRRFRMSRRLFLRIVTKLGDSDVYFTQRHDALGIFPDDYL